MNINKETLIKIKKCNHLFKLADQKQLKELIDEINSISKEDIKKQLEDYEKRQNIEKITKIRYLLLKKILEDNINENILNEIKIIVNKEYDTNILNSWSDFRILYSLYYFYYKNEIMNILKEISQTLIDNSENKFTFTHVGFDGSRNLGSKECWIAIYDKELKSQSEQIQFFINFNENISYGFFNYKTDEHISKKEIKYEDFNLEDIQNSLNENLKLLFERPNDSLLGSPFNEIFKNKNQAEFFFDFTKEKLSFLGVTSSSDEKFTVTIPKKSSRNLIRVIFGSWLVFDFEKNTEGYFMRLALQKRNNYINIKEEGLFNKGVLDEQFALYLMPYNEIEKFNKYIESDFKIIKEKFKTWNKTQYHHKGYQELKDAIFDENIRKKILKDGIKKINLDESTDKMKNINQNIFFDKFPKNTILYGPPGTGKTFSLKRKVCEIAGFNLYDKDEIDKKFNELKKEERVEFITFHPSYSYEEFVEGISVDTDSDELKYIKKDGIFKRISEKARKNYLLSKQKDIFSFEDVFSDFSKELEDKEKIEVKTSRSKFYITKISETTIYFDKEKGDSQHTLSIQTLKKIFEDNDCKKHIKGGLEGYYQGLLNILNKSKFNYKLNSQDLKSYFLLIDEINRGDMAKIFGELITLLEDDKRLGENNELIVQLPYSQEDFGVPPNLYLIGTMNTADRSIALIDIALRRRFDFEEMMPDLEEHSSLYTEIERILDTIEFEMFNNFRTLIIEINKNICENEEIGRDKQIGHAFLFKIKKGSCENDINRIWNKKIIPLLEEYSYGDIGIVKNLIPDNKDLIEKLSFIKEENKYYLNKKE